MMNSLKTTFLTVAAAAMALAPCSMVLAQNAPGLGDLVGARGPGAEQALADRGYAASGNLGAASMWWNGASGQCVSMLVDNGRVQSIQSATPGNCGKSPQAARAGRSGGCPVDVSEADRYKYPACDNPQAGDRGRVKGDCPPDVSEADRYRYPACN